jgi:hypothetical protein
MTKTNKLRLYEILLFENRILYPNVPDNCRAITIAVDTNEKGIKANLESIL